MDTSEIHEHHENQEHSPDCSIRRDAKDNIDLTSAFNCSICQETYRTPKILPACGHSFCLECIRRTAGRLLTVTCPECQTVNKIGSRTNPIAGLTTNVQLQRAVDMLKIAKEQFEEPNNVNSPKKKVATSFTDVCPHVILSKSPITCEHCTVKFCKSCQVGHMERMRLEMLALGSTFSSRIEATSAKLATTIEDVRKFVRNQVSNTEAEICASCEDLEETFRTIVQERKTSLVKKAREIGDMQLAETDDIILKVDGGNPIDFDRLVAELKSGSVLNFTLDDLATMYGKLAQRNKEIEKLENLHDYVFHGEFTLSQIDNIKSAVIAQLSGFDDSLLRYKSKEEIEKELAEDALLRLHAAAKAGNTDFIKETLLNRRFSVAGYDSLLDHRDGSDNGRTILHQAASQGHLETVKFLVEEMKADVFARDSTDCKLMPVHLAAENGHLEVVKYLLEKHPEIWDVDSKTGYMIAVLAVEHGHLELVDFLTNQHKALVTTKCLVLDRTLLHMAAFADQLAIFKLLVDKGADLYATDRNGEMPIHSATSFGSVDVIAYLLEIKSDLLNMKNFAGEMPIDKAVSAHKNEVVKLLLQNAKQASQ